MCVKPDVTPKKLDLSNEMVFTVSLLFYAACKESLY